MREDLGGGGADTRLPQRCRQSNCDGFDIRYQQFFFFSSRRRHTRFDCDWSSDVCSSDLPLVESARAPVLAEVPLLATDPGSLADLAAIARYLFPDPGRAAAVGVRG